MKRRKHNQDGNVLIIVMVLFIVLSLSISMGLVAPVLRAYRIAQNDIRSVQSFALAESGAEDAYYRIKSNQTISNTETISTGTNSVSTIISTIGGGEKNIVATGDVSGAERTVTIILKTGTGVVFKYGTQAGQGGIEFGNNAGLFGSLYSNGNIYAQNGAFVTGDVFVADSPALMPNQVNNTPSLAASSITFGNSNTTQDIAQSFAVSETGMINKVRLNIKKVGSPGNATVRLTSGSGSTPGTTNMATGTLNANLVTSNFGWVDVAFSSNPQLTAGTTYWFGMDATTSSQNYYVIAVNTSYTLGQAKTGQYGGSWSTTGVDTYFELFLGGLTGIIDNLDIGTGGSGNAYAHTITNSTITGTAYCQVESGNNTSCNTSRPAPAQENLPISDANVEEWKEDAELGGVHTGDYTISSPTNLGPKKIVGNLTVNDTLTITDTIWVTGNVIINDTVKLSSSYGATSGLIIADGYISTANNVEFQDSGTPGSYIMLLSTSTCDSDRVGNPCGTFDAISIANNSSITIANAQKGSIRFSNNASIKEAVGNKIKLSNNATLSYGSGLINTDFSSGPTGAWTISSWKETE